MSLLLLLLFFFFFFFFVTDIDECTTNEHNCDLAATCGNSIGSFDCTCNSGYSGDGLTCLGKMNDSQRLA